MNLPQTLVAALFFRREGDGSIQVIQRDAGVAPPRRDLCHSSFLFPEEAEQEHSTIAVGSSPSYSHNATPNSRTAQMNIPILYYGHEDDFASVVNVNVDLLQ